MNIEPLFVIEIEGHVDLKRKGWFEEMEMLHKDNGNTLLTGRFCDQAKLYAALNRIRDLGLKLVALKRKE